jgi:hypothetical protein
MRHDARKGKFDRFARNRTDALAIKLLLRHDYGVKVFSVSEPSEDSDGPMGALIEGIMESVADWYSQNLATSPDCSMRKGIRRRLIARFPGIQCASCYRTTPIWAKSATNKRLTIKTAFALEPRPFNGKTASMYRLLRKHSLSSARRCGTSPAAIVYPLTNIIPIRCAIWSSVIPVAAIHRKARPFAHMARCVHRCTRRIQNRTTAV